MSSAASTAAPGIGSWQASRVTSVVQRSTSASAVALPNTARNRAPASVPSWRAMSRAGIVPDGTRSATLCSNRSTLLLRSAFKVWNQRRPSLRSRSDICLPLSASPGVSK